LALGRPLVNNGRLKGSTISFRRLVMLCSGNPGPPHQA
jgi:hypothetical protein